MSETKLQVGVKVLIKKENKYLFLRRHKNFKSGAPEWDIPGGRIEPEEALSDALAREVYEETALVLDKPAELLAAQDIFVPSKSLHVVRLTYQAPASGKVSISNEHDEYKWMTQEEIAAEPHVDSYMKEVLEERV
jgi:8-oxo-dGTP diphosphatase